MMTNRKKLHLYRGMETPRGGGEPEKQTYCQRLFKNKRRVKYLQDAEDKFRVSPRACPACLRAVDDEQAALSKIRVPWMDRDGLVHQTRVMKWGYEWARHIVCSIDPWDLGGRRPLVIAPRPQGCDVTVAEAPVTCLGCLAR